MGAVVEVKYFNTFILKKVNNTDEPVWNGSFGIPSDRGGYPVVTGITGDNNYNLEESRIRGGYNNTTVDFGVKAYLVDDNNAGNFRLSSLIYSGIFNSRTGINQTNVFSVGEEITKTADPSKGSIQKLYAEDSNLTIFQEDKVNRALIDKDAIYSAEGGGAVTNSNLVIGTIQQLPGEYGISKNPESFAVYGYNKYFTDRNSSVVLRLSGGSMQEISNTGMRDYFRDQFAFNSHLLGGYDIHNNQYVLSVQGDILSGVIYNKGHKTLSYDEQSQGWVSFFSYEPEQMLSVQNKYYTIKDGKVYEHYSTDVKRGSFYSSVVNAEVSTVFNPAPDNSKTFKTISYEGSNGWRIKSIISDPTGVDTQPDLSSITNFDRTTSIPSYYGGEYVDVRSEATCAITSNSTTVLLNSSDLVPVGSVLDSKTIVVPNNTTVTASSIVQGFVTASNVSSTTVTIVNVGYEIPVGTQVTGEGLSPNTQVVSYDSSTGVLVISEAASLFINTPLTFQNLISITVSATVPFVVDNTVSFSLVAARSEYTTAFGTEYPPYPRYRAGFCRKENNYVANLINNSPASSGEIVFGNQMSGIKGYFATATFVTDKTTDPGGEKQLFMVASDYVINNGY